MGKSGRKTLLKMDSFTTFKSWKKKKKTLPKASLRAVGLAVAMDVVQQLIIMAVTNAKRQQQRNIRAAITIFIFFFFLDVLNFLLLLRSDCNSFSFLYVLFASVFSPTGIFNRANKTRKKNLL